MKSICCNTQEVKSLLSGLRTSKRIPIKPQSKYCALCMVGLLTSEQPIIVENGIIKAANATLWKKVPYQRGDILYVKETWRTYAASYPPGKCEIEYKAGGKAEFDEVIALPTVKGEWKPPVHMPQKAARIFLRVTDVRVERLQDITTDGIRAEGLTSMAVHAGDVDIATQEFKQV